MGWTEFALALAVFFLSHAVPVRPPFRPAAVRLLGAGGFTLAYSALSLAVLAWLIVAAGRAPYVPVWNWAPWQNHLALGAMFLVCVIVALTLGRPNPFSFGGTGAEGFDPSRPGLIRWMRHPMLVALAIWAAAHAIANGDLAHVILFGTFAVFAVLGRRLIDRRRQRAMGADWDRLRLAMAMAPVRPDPTAETWVRLLAAVAIYAGLLWLHPMVFGVDPLI